MVPEEEVLIIVQVKPNARQNRLIKFENNILHLAIVAPPVNGKANRELIRFLSDLLIVSKSNLIIKKGLKSRRKTISVTGSIREQLADMVTKLSA